MGALASEITSLTIVYSTFYSGADQRKHQSSASLAFCAENSPVTGEFPAQMANNTENVSIWWCHHVLEQCLWQNPPLFQPLKMAPYYKLLSLFSVFLCAVASDRKNVLFLIADDLRPQLNCYQGKDFPSPVSPTMHTPNLDKLASTSLLLKRAHVQQALCSPSRTSLLTGRRPDTTHVYDLRHYFRTYSGNFTTIPQYFKEQGYRTIGAGKVFQPGLASDNNDPISWTDPYYMPDKSMNHYETFDFSWRAVSPTERKQIALPDDLITEFAIKTLKELASTSKSGTQPFFLAVGFQRPRPPIVYPEEYSDYYPLDDIRLPPNPYVPIDMPYVAWWDDRSWWECEPSGRPKLRGRARLPSRDTPQRMERCSGWRRT